MSENDNKQTKSENSAEVEFAVSLSVINSIYKI